MLSSTSQPTMQNNLLLKQQIVEHNKRHLIVKTDFLSELMELKSKLAGGINRSTKSIKDKRNALNELIIDIQTLVNNNSTINVSLIAEEFINNHQSFNINVQDGTFRDLIDFISYAARLADHEEVQSRYFCCCIKKNPKTQYIKLALNHDKAQKYLYTDTMLSTQSSHKSV
jgi:hypothetical protein